MKRNFWICTISSLLAVAIAMSFTGCSLFRSIGESVTETNNSDSIHQNNATDTNNSGDASTDVFAPATSDDETTESEQTSTPVEPTIRTASFIGAGDNLIYYGNVRDAQSCAVQGGRTYNFAPHYANVKAQIEAADIAFINQETLMCGEGYALSYYPHFNSPQDLGHDLVEVGFDVINIANNHMLDKGANGLSATMDFYDTLENITMIGGYRDRADYENIRVVETNGIRVAFLAYTFMTNFIRLDAGSSIVIPYPDMEAVPGEVAKAKEIADFVIVSVHWGDESSFTPNAEQRSFAALLAECGVDAIIGHHSHVIQPVEWIEREDGGRTLCVYSLGNFVGEQAFDYNMLGGMISFNMVLTDGVPAIEDVQFIPTVYYHNISFYKNQVFYLKDFTQELASTHGLPYYGRTLSLETLKRYLSNTISAEFLTEYAE